jgi:UDPglucose 6-dehydrogenase
MKIAVIGTGYVGLVSGTCLAEVGHDVTCMDTSQDKIDRLNKGEIPIYEPGLDALVANNRQAGRLHFTTDLAQALDGIEVVMIAVGTPTRALDGNADLQYVFAAATSIATTLTHPAVIVTKSTVPAGTGHDIKRRIRELAPALDLDFCARGTPLSILWSRIALLLVRNQTAQKT